MKHKPQIGSISSGTLRAEDLFASFLYECEHIKLSRAERNAVRRIASNRVESNDETLEERLDNDVQELTDILSNNAPAYFYFGAHPGDGADFGYWLSEDFEQEFDGLKVSDLAEVPRGFSGEVLLVNDHGNMTLYAFSRGRGREVWGIV